MPALVSPSLASPGVSSSSSTARARPSEEPQGRSFHAALDRSRASQADADAGTTDGTAARPGTRRGTAAAKDETAPEIPNLDFFVPALPAHVTADAARAGAEAVAGAALRNAAQATERTDVQAALTTTDAAADAAKAVTGLELPTADATAKAALADVEPAATAADALQGAAGKASASVAAQADAAAAAAAARKADTAAATPATAPPINAALIGTVPTTPAPTARNGRADAANRDATTPSVAGTAAAAGAAEADPIDLLAARIEATASSDAGLADDRAPDSSLAWMAAQTGSTGVANGPAATESRAPVLTLAPPIDSDAWAPALGQQMLRMSASGMHTAQLSINPENLGPMQITLKLGDDQAQAMFVTAHESVRKAVEAALPQLRTTLAEHGISLGQTSVGADTRQPASQSGFAGDNPSGRSGSNGGSAYAGAARNGAVAANALPAAPVRSARAEGAVDTFA